MSRLRKSAPSAATAARVTVSAHSPGALRWTWFVVGLIAGAVLAAALAVGFVRFKAGSPRDAAKAAVTLEDVDAVRARVQELTEARAGQRKEIERLQGLVDASDSRIRVEQATSAQLAAQMRTLEAENVRLKSDLMYLESLLPSSENEGLLEIRGLQVLPDAVPHQMRWRAMLVQGGRKSREFKGRLQLVVKYEVDRKPASLVLPKRNGGRDDDEMKVSFERAERVEGRFQVPAGAVVKSVQLRVLKGSSVQAQQSLSL